MSTAATERILLALDVASASNVAIHVSAALLLIALIVKAHRWIRRRSPVLGGLFAGGVIIRAVLGVALFLISFFELPLFRRLQLGGGFWTLALDGRTYFEIASNATEHGLATITSSLPSPMYLRTLTVWMWLFGASPASAVLLNVASYVVCAVLVVVAGKVSRQPPSSGGGATALTLAALTLSPALLIFSTQPVKDPVCMMFLVAGITGALVWWTALADRSRDGVMRASAGALLVTIGVYSIGGIRAYLALFMLAAFASAAVYSVVVRTGGTQRVSEARRHAVLIAVLWAVFVVGAGPYAQTYQEALFSTGGSRSTPIVALDSAREAFSATGGATAIDQPKGPQSGDFGSSDGQHGQVKRLIRLIRGLAVLLIPISVLSAASIVHFGGGQGLLLLTDLDTVAMDVVVFVSLWLVVRSARRERMSPATVFALVLALLVTTSMAYVVTNYGTLFRLRLMGLTPIAMLPVMISGRTRPKTMSTASHEVDEDDGRAVL